MKLPRLRAVVSRRLTESQKIVLKRLRHGEQGWQRTLSHAVANRVSYNLADDSQGGQPAVVDSGYDARAAMTAVNEEVRQVLSRAGIEFVELPRISHYRPILVIRQASVIPAVQALSELRADEGWHVRAFGMQRRRLRRALIERDPDALRRITVRRRIVAPNERQMSTYKEMLSIEPWEELGFGVERVDGSTHIQGTLHRLLNAPRAFVDYMIPDQWRAAVDDDGGKLRLGAPHLYQVEGPIDLVYTWVDGDDPDWNRRKREVLGEGDPTALNETATSASRFESRDELKYSLRSVEHYASWVNHIYIVTDRQVPPWLDIGHPKVTVVDHREIFRRSDVLPVFNSHAIESQLHHIPGLSERYLYMNDDLMFMRPTEPELFFTSNGLTKFFPSKAPLDLTESSSRDLPVLSAAKRGRDFMIRRFGRTVTNKFKHTPHPQQRSVLEEFEREEPALFEAVSASRFRHPDDYSIPSALYHYYAYATSRAVIGAIRYAYMDIARDDARLYLDRLQRRRNIDVLCLNDTHVDPSRRDELNELVAEFFENRFPVASSFERK